MAYVTGTASSIADLATALKNACVANGWTLAGNVVHKFGCYASISTGQLGDTSAAASSRLHLRVGNGIDGSNNLTDQAPILCGLGVLRAAGTGTTYPDWDWPAAYHIHILTDPDEVYLFVNYGGQQFWQWVAFGQTDSPGNAGSGNWQCASLYRPYDTDGTGVFLRVDRCSLTTGGASIYTNSPTGAFIPAPFALTRIQNINTRAVNSSAIHGAINDGTGLPAWSLANYGWEGASDTIDADIIARGPQVNMFHGLSPLLDYGPNAWNQQLVLLPSLILQKRPSSKVSVIGELSHLRMCRNDYVDPGSIVTLGSDKWRVYPCYRRDLANRNPIDLGGSASGSQDHSGTIAMAIRYDGP